MMKNKHSVGILYQFDQLYERELLQVVGNSILRRAPGAIALRVIVVVIAYSEDIFE